MDLTKEIEYNSDLTLTHTLQQASQLPMDTQLKIAAKLLGYRKMPPTITQFVKDDYYLGSVTRNLYPFWIDKLEEIFPTPIHTSTPILVLGGGLGIGKSTFSRICADYMLCRLDHLKDPHKSIGLMPGKKIVFNFMMPTSTAADEEFIQTINNWNEESPYFRDGMMNGTDEILMKTEGLIGKGQIGKDVLFYVLSELNFLPYHKAFDKLNTALTRWDSRFGRCKEFWGMIIIDTSSKNEDSISEEFAQSNPYGDLVRVIKTNQWEVRKHLNYYFRKGSFQVYAGDATHSPFIVTKDNPITMDLDKDRVITVPEELRPDFEFDVEKALMDKAGISLKSTDRFIPDAHLLDKCYSIPTTYTDVIDVDFFDKNDRIIYKLEDSLRLIPEDRILFIHYDIGVTGDNTGLGISYFDKWEDYGIDAKTNKKMRLPRVVVPIAVGIGRRKDQETSIFKLQEFVIDLSNRNEVYFSADQYASRQLLQNLEIVGIQNKYISVDRTDSAYIYLKTLMTNGLIQLPNNKLLRSEIANLKRVGRKIDHPSDGSKDIADAVCGSVYNLYQNLDAAGQLSNKYMVSGHTSAIESRTNKPSDVFQGMVDSIFG